MDLTGKHILDATCGSRTIWFNKNCAQCVYMDRREEHGTAIWRSTINDSVRRIDVEPDVVADFTEMPFPDNCFDLVVFDPPHMMSLGENSWMRKKYGALPKDWQNVIHDGFCECWRVLRPRGTLIFKWCEVEIPTREIIGAIGKEPLFGHRSGKRSNTQWMTFMKFPEDHDGIAD